MITDQVQFRHVFREANFVVDAIAANGHSLDVAMWNHSLPLCLFCFQLILINMGRNDRLWLELVE